MAVNLSADLLRAFVTVSDLASYTKAGDVLGRTQPAISLQIRRLEELIPQPWNRCCSKCSFVGAWCQCIDTENIYQRHAHSVRGRRISCIGEHPGWTLLQTSSPERRGCYDGELSDSWSG